MSPPPWANPAQLIFLNGRKADFKYHQGQKSLSTFWDDLHRDFFIEWTCPEDEARGAAPEEVSKNKRRRSRVPKEESWPDVESWVEDRKLKLNNWFNNHGIGKKSCTKGPVIQLGLHMADQPKRLQTELHIYSKKYFAERVKPGVDAECLEKGIDEHGRIAVVNRHLANCYAKESQEVKDEVRKLRKEQEEAKDAARDAAISDVKQEHSPEDYASAIEYLPEIFDQVCKHVDNTTGWAVTIIAGGPDPMNDGNIRTIGFHSHKNKYGLSFGKASKSFQDSYLKPFSAFLHTVYSADDMKKRAIGYEAEKIESPELALPDKTPETAPSTSKPKPNPVASPPRAPTLTPGPGQVTSPQCAPDLEPNQVASPPRAPGVERDQVAPPNKAPMMPSSVPNLTQPSPVNIIDSQLRANERGSENVPDSVIAMNEMVIHDPHVPAPLTPHAQNVSTSPVSFNPASMHHMMVDTSPATNTQIGPGGTFAGGTFAGDAFAGDAFAGGSFASDSEMFAFHENMLSSLNTMSDEDFRQLFNKTNAYISTPYRSNGESLPDPTMTSYAPNPLVSTPYPSSNLLASTPYPSTGICVPDQTTTFYTPNTPLPSGIPAASAPYQSCVEPASFSMTTGDTASWGPKPANCVDVVSQIPEKAALSPPKDLQELAMHIAGPAALATTNEVQGESEVHLPDTSAVEEERATCNRKPAGSKEVVALTEQQGKLPEWLDLARQYLADGIKDEVWRGLLEVWLSFEKEHLLLSTAHRLPTAKLRPEELSKWLSSRKYQVVPTVSDPTAFADQWCRWWNSLQSPSRQSDGPRIPVRLSTLGENINLSAIKKGGPNGLVTVLIGLKWWATTRREDARWTDAVADIRECFEWFGKTGGKRKAAGDEGDGNVAKKKKGTT